MAGQKQKPRGQLQNQRGGRGAQITVLPAAEVSIPPAPDDILPEARQVWIDFWSGAIAQLVDRKTQMPACRRWIEAVSEVARLTPLARAEPVVSGSTGQPRKNPLYDVIQEHTRAIERFEEHFGGTLMAQMRLGIAIGEAAETLEGLQASLNTVPDPGDDEELLEYLSNSIEADFSAG